MQHALPAESLENRLLLTVNTSDLFAPRAVAGNQWTYAGTTTGGATSTLIQTAIGPTTFMGQSVSEVDSGSAAKPNALKSYEGQDGAGDFVTFGSVLSSGTRTQTDVYSPYQGAVPQIVSGGTPYTTNLTDTETDTSTAAGTTPTTYTSTETDVITLLSETPTSLTVGAGTYSCYDFQEVQTIVTPNGDDTNSTSTTTTNSFLAPNVGLVQSVTTGAATLSLVSFKNATDMLAFIQQPSNVAVGDKIAPPITVAVETSAGVYDTTATGSVAISVSNTSTGIGTLSGTLTEPVVAGFATFSDLSINMAGDYQLIATDVATVPIAPAPSEPFTIVDGKLSYQTPPVDGTENTPLKPIVVQLTDGMGNVATTDNSTVITLNPIGFTSANPIRGNTATVVAGVATFSNLVLSKPGFYTLQASDAAGDAVATSGKFKVAGDSLAFALPPANADPQAPIPLSVKILNLHGGLDTTATSSIVLTLNRVTGGSNSVLSGTTTLPFVAGKAIFSAADAPTINIAGTYTLTATEEDFSTGVLAPTGTTTAINSRQFVISGLHLKVKKSPPGSVDVLTQVPLVISLVDSKGNIDTSENAAQVQLSLLTVAGGAGAVLSGTTAVTFKNGIATFTTAAGPSINSVGTFKLVASEIGSVAPATDVTTGAFKTVGYHYDIEFLLHSGFNSPQADNRLFALSDDSAAGNQYFVVYLRDKNNKQVTAMSAPNLMVTVTAIQGAGQLLSDPITTPRVFSVYYADCDISAAGVYDITLSAVESGAEIPAASVEPLVLKSRQVYDADFGTVLNGPHSALAQQNIISTSYLHSPRASGKGLPIFTSQSAGVSVTLAAQSGHGVLTGDQTYSFSNSVGAQLQITEPGNYTLTFTDVVTPGGLPFDPANYAPASEAVPVVISLHILPDKLAIVQQPPVAASVGQSFNITVQLTDSSGNLISDFNDSADDDGSVLVIVLTSRASFAGGVNDLQNASPMILTGGQAVFANLSFSTHGIHVIHASEMLMNSSGILSSVPGAIDAISSVTHVT